MAFANYEDIAALIDSTEDSEGRLKVYFRCPQSDKVVEAHGRFPDSTRRNMANSAKRSAIRAGLRELSALIRRMTGFYIPLGGAYRSTNDDFVSDDDRKAAAVAAFETIAEYPGKPVRRGRFNRVDDAWVYVD